MILPMYFCSANEFCVNLKLSLGSTFRGTAHTAAAAVMFCDLEGPYSLASRFIKCGPRSD